MAFVKPPQTQTGTLTKPERMFMKTLNRVYCGKKYGICTLIKIEDTPFGKMARVRLADGTEMLTSNAIPVSKTIKGKEQGHA
jgi:hypothetical protein